ncbi:MAG: TRAP transporter fused permease subunit [Tindallia sp. MSAO_Bac2]|nr:MAG: TRAP transporter fused permease subunit [Tindallia sp. MSAO_Bac2]
MNAILTDFKNRSIRENITFVLAFALAGIHLYTLRYISFPPHVQLAIFLSFILTLTFLIKKSKYLIIDLTFIFLSLAPLIYLIVKYRDIIRRPTLATDLEVVLSVMLLVAVLEASRRCVGPVIAIISIGFIAYAFMGPYLPGIFAHRGFSLARFTSTIYITTNGIFATPLRVAASMIFTFILFGSMLMNAGVDSFFTKISKKMASGLRGGPAKVAVIISGLFGTVSGSSAANVVTTGQLTIPVMKKAGYKPEFAAAVESAASTGGALMPPIMAAGAFIIAELTEVPYRDVVIAGVIPALLFYLGIFTSVHFEAVRLKLGYANLPDQNDDAKKSVLKDFHLIIPFMLLIYLIMIYYPVLRAALYAMIALVILSIINPYCKYGLKNIVDGFAEGAQNTIGVTTACACSGIIIGIIGATGFGLKFSSFILRDGTPYMLAIFLTMVIVIILGMGLPGVAAYIVGISVAGPILNRLGIDPLAAHLFVFYFSNMAVITPPVAITAYAASGLANSDPFKTGVQAALIALPGFIVPFIFIQEPALLLEGELLSMVIPIFTASAGVFSLAVGVVGCFISPLAKVNRFVFIIGGLFMIAGSGLTDIIGLAIIAIAMVLNYKKYKSKGSVQDGNDNNREDSVENYG